VLALFALLVFVVLAVAGLTIDLGFTLLTRREMQTAVNTAALEGLRFRDEIPAAFLTDASFLNLVQAECGDPPSQPQTLTDPDWIAWREKVRRWLARKQVALTYTDGIDPITGNAVQFGAGPVFQLSGGVGDANALQTLTPSKTGDVVVYKPDVQLNFANNPVGDVVSGNFLSGMPASETSDYQRLDFEPQAPGGDAFLARLRRTKDTHGNDRNPADNQPGVSTTGNALPLLFGQGSLIAGQDPASGYSLRHHGITVRATAIAQARRVLSVGLSDPQSSLIGATPFVLDKAALWDAAQFTGTPPTPVTATVDVAGNITVQGVAGGPHGWFVVTPPTVVGQTPGPAAAVSPQQVFPINGFVPVYQATANGSAQPAVIRVIGFGRVTMTLTSGTPGTTPLTVELTKGPMQIASENASAKLLAPLNLLDETELNNLLTLHQNLAEPLLAPALVR
jgi:hypothetical protein